MSKKKILVIMGRYLPGYKDGGPVQSIKNLVDFLGDEYEFMILTNDRDHGDKNPYPNICINSWNEVGKARVYYLPPKGFTFKVIKEVSKNVDLIYVCGCFDLYAIKTLCMKKLGIIKNPLIIAAMGLFSPMEFRLKYYKKKTFTTLFNVLGMFDGIYWSATSLMEMEEISQQIRVNNNIFIAEDVPRKVDDYKIIKEKEENKLNIVWISRISPKKNLKGAIEILKKVNSEINFTIYGPIHDADYWEQCQLEITQLPNNIKCIYKGSIQSENVVKELQKHHVFLFPTLGENYGHVIQEALSAGCPCILSDQTPWIDLEVNDIGASYSLQNESQFISLIHRYSKMDKKEFNIIVEKTIKYVVSKSNFDSDKNGYKKMFGEVLH